MLENVIFLYYREGIMSDVFGVLIINKNSVTLPFNMILIWPERPLK